VEISLSSLRRYGRAGGVLKFVVPSLFS
jgi:hypothetical protein